MTARLSSLLSSARNLLPANPFSAASAKGKETDEKSPPEDFFNAAIREGTRYGTEGALQGMVRVLDDKSEVITGKLKKILLDTLFVESPQELPFLRSLLAKCLPNSTTKPSRQEIEQIHNLLLALSLGEEDDDEPLMELSSRIQEEGIAEHGKQKIAQLVVKLSQLLQQAPPLKRKEAAESKENKRGPLLPLPSPAAPPEEPSEVRLSAKTMALCKDVYEFVELLTYYNQGFLQTGAQFLQKFLMQLAHDETGLLKILERQLTAPDIGLLHKVLETMKQRIGESGGLLDTLSEGLSSQPHTLLAKAKEALHAMLNAKPDKMQTLALKAREAIRAVREHAAAIFVKFPLKEEELEALAKCDLLLSDLEFGGRVSLPELQNGIQRAYDILNTHFNKEEGLFPRAARVFIETVTDKVSKIPEKFLSTLKRKKEEKKAKEASPGPKENEEISLWDYLISAQEFLSDPLAKTSRGVGHCMLWVLRGVERRIEKNAEYEQTRQVLHALTQNIEKSMNSERGMDLLQAIQKSLQHPGFKHLQFYLNGIKIPKMGIEKKESSSIAAFIANMQQHEAAVFQNPKKERTAVNYDKLIKEEQAIFIKKTSCFGTMKLVFWITGVPQDEQFFSTVLKNDVDKLKDAFLKKVEGLSNASFTKWICKALFRLLYPFADLMIGQFSKRFTKKIQDRIKSGVSVGDFSPLKYVSRSFSILQGAFERVAENSMIDGDLEEMVIAELERKEVNKDLTSPELFRTVSTKFIDQFMPRIEISTLISRWLAQLQFAEGSSLVFLNSTLKVLTNVVSFLFSAIFYIPEKVSNKIIAFLLKRFAFRTELFDTIIKKNLDALQGNRNYIHAFNSVVYQQLEVIWGLLQKTVTQGGGLDLGALGGELGKGQKKELTKLVKHMMQVLENSEFDTPKELRKFIKDKSTLQKLRETAESVFVTEAVEAATRLIAVAYKSLTEKDQMQKLFYHFLSSVNRSYSIGKPVSPEEFQTMEKGINTLVSRILTLAIKLSLEKRFDFSLQTLQKEQQMFMDDLKLKAEAFAVQSKPTLVEIPRSLHDPSKVGQCMTQLTSLINSSLEFQRARVSLQFKANANSALDTETQRNFDKISSELATLFAEFGPLVNEAMTLLQDIALHEKNGDHLLTIQNILRTIGEKVAIEDFDEQDAAFCRRQLELLEERIASLRQVERLEKKAIAMFGQKEHLKDGLETWANDKKSISFLRGNILSSDCLFSQLILIKRAALKGKRDRAKLSKLQKELGLKLEKASFLKLKEELKILMKAKNINALLASEKQFRQSVSAIVAKLEERTQASLQQMERASQAIQKEAQSTHEIDPALMRKKRAKIEELLDFARAACNKIEFWAKELKPIGIINPPLLEMSWFIDIAKNIANDQIEEMVQKFLDFIHKRYNYVAVVRHGLLVPYAKGF